MAINNFIPTIWSARVLENLHKAQVFGAVANRNYEGEIKGYGDTVKINGISGVTIASYTKNSTTVTPEVLTDSTQSLLINQADYFAFGIDDVDTAQQNPKIMEAAIREAAYGLSDAAEKYIAGLYTSATTSLTPTFSAVTDAYNCLVSVANAMDEANVPKDDTRYVVVTPWFHSLLLLDSRFISAGTIKTDDVLANGFVGRAAGLNIYVSNNVAKVSNAYKIMAGYSETITFAEQINSVEALRDPSAFKDDVRGLHLYGAKVVRPASLVCVSVERPTSLI